MHWSWSSFVTTAQVWLVLFVPREGRYGLKALIAAVFVPLGEGLLLSGADGAVLLNALVLLASGLLFLAEIASSSQSPLVPLMWAVVGLAGTFFLIWRRDELIAWTEATRSPLVIGCAVAALLLVPLAVRGRRLRDTVRYDPHDLSGL
ncbi:hypothetical protein GCM10018793_67250 [Streptomyces sulfonofaciens]|uniref:Uncharacterized protein n=1 Tax=Streptomyces sulfonofaciens TaxID=68272 RepID=A0A919GP99_9ACTN|nr:hypothetical protein [Streptomyces sulfonofaciens]GHH88247.1 hypothetical protein GCM10018793_67250 [Streptomyces sulfonofaciens]